VRGAWVPLSRRPANELYICDGTSIALQSMVITKQPQIGGEGNTMSNPSMHPTKISLHFPIGEFAHDLQFRSTTTRE
jgi:hypothetical protein